MGVAWNPVRRVSVNGGREQLPPAQSFGHRLGARWGLPTLPPAYGQKIVLGSTISGDLCKRIASQALYLRS